MPSRATRLVAIVLLLAATACGSGALRLPPTRPLIVQSGERLNPDRERLKEVYRWVNAQVINIERDPSFLIATDGSATDVYPWETLEIRGDTAYIRVRRTNPDLASAYQIYAHLHLMKAMGRVDEWMPEAPGAEGWDFERAVMNRTSDAWLLGRASFGFAPSRIMDEVVYAREADQLDALLLTLRGHEFPEAKEAWLAENPDGQEEFYAWFRETFGRDFNSQ
jgi:hypothetical protein